MSDLYVVVWKDGIYEYMPKEEMQEKQDLHDFLVAIPATEVSRIVLSQITDIVDAETAQQI